MFKLALAALLIASADSAKIVSSPKASSPANCTTDAALPIQLTDSTIEQFLVENNNAMINFCLPAGDDCAQMAKEWDIVAKTVSELDIPIAIGSMDCAQHPQVCEKYNIDRYPTLRWKDNFHVRNLRTSLRADEALKVIQGKLERLPETQRLRSSGQVDAQVSS